MGGMVLETNMNEIVAQIEAQNRLEKSEVSHVRPFALASLKSLGQKEEWTHLMVCVAGEP